MRLNEHRHDMGKIVEVESKLAGSESKNDEDNGRKEKRRKTEREEGEDEEKDRRGGEK